MSQDGSITEQLVTTNRILANEGILRGFGHVSARKPGTDELLISRSLSPALVTEDDIVTMDLDGEVLDDPDARTYKETVIHRAIYRHRDDVNAVIHHHAPAVMPFTITDVEIKPAFHMAAIFHDGVPKFDDYDDEFGRLVATEAEGDRMAAELGDRRAQLIEGHGANVVGANLKEALLSTMYFVMNAEYQAAAHDLGDPSYYTGPEESLESMIDDVILTPLVVDRMWTFLTSRLPARG